VTGAAALPLLAIRLGRLPMPPVDAGGGPAPPERAAVFSAVARTDETLTGMLLGLVPAGVFAALLLARSGGLAGRVLIAVAATAFLLRARLFVTVRQRLPLLGLGLAGYAALLFGVLVGGRPAVAVLLATLLVVAAVVVAVAGGRYAQRTPSPYLGRAADVLDAVCVVSVLPVACAVLGLYDQVRALVS
jgi:hypothetical protein